MTQRLTVDAFADALWALAAGLAPMERRLVALAGPPGAGKSTIAARIEARFAPGDDGDAPLLATLPMDGYHYDDGLLDRLGRRERKGAPDTFDVGGLHAMLKRLAANEEPAIAVPRFDRDLEIARAGAALIDQAAKLVLVEGNYLLFDEPPWTALRDVFDLTAMIVVDEDTLRARLTERWVSQGLAPTDVQRRVEDNDLPNGRHLMSASRPADILITQTQLP